ncbi:putative anti-sigma regulatory factor (serine/threonine protein kinase) [Blastopirellula marina DSM 3645]|uniref:Putative anti-sigma regulatory factor (Serine/threonine protein kinase) n=1 Tax=Blastopirellula marina DSM 3645 TaxID=314230 RepID=A3ZU13_9BACT|nr:putative anti-sigma regulatory factor (serine/threonine protein kinase) [Blastopirellula marina DSM 3645]
MGASNNWLWTCSETIPSETHEGQRLVKQLLSKLEEHSWGMSDVFGIHLAAEEAIVNAIKHGNAYNPEKNVQIEMNVGADRVSLRITDEGPGFNPVEVPDPTEEENLENESGRGVMLIKAYMTDVRYNDRGNSVFMEKVRSQ